MVEVRSATKIADNEYFSNILFAKENRPRTPDCTIFLRNQ